jgi:hypothetical protein
MQVTEFVPLCQQIQWFTSWNANREFQKREMGFKNWQDKLPPKLSASICRQMLLFFLEKDKFEKSFWGSCCGHIFLRDHILDSYLCIEMNNISLTLASQNEYVLYVYQLRTATGSWKWKSPIRYGFTIGVFLRDFWSTNWECLPVGTLLLNPL